MHLRIQERKIHSAFAIVHSHTHRDLKDNVEGIYTSEKFPLNLVKLDTFTSFQQAKS